MIKVCTYRGDAWQPAILLATLALLLPGCVSPLDKPDANVSLNATLWSYTGAEYTASTIQAYRIATTNLDTALADSQWTAALEQQGDYSDLPPAVLLDIDQTVLDNSLYNARIVTQYGEYTQETFSSWCEEVSATAIPGAKEFIDYAAARNVTIIYYSRRLESLRDCTTRNLQALGFTLSEQKFLLLNNQLPETNKAHLRRELSKQFRILLLVGDDLEDFFSGSKKESTKRRDLASRYAARWGREWIILPNPMYGAWDTSLYGFDYELPTSERLDLKLQHLQE